MNPFLIVSKHVYNADLTCITSITRVLHEIENVERSDKIITEQSNVSYAVWCGFWICATQLNVCHGSFCGWSWLRQNLRLTGWLHFIQSTGARLCLHVFIISAFVLFDTYENAYKYFITLKLFLHEHNIYIPWFLD